MPNEPCDDAISAFLVTLPLAQYKTDDFYYLDLYLNGVVTKIADTGGGTVLKLLKPNFDFTNNLTKRELFL